MFVYHNYNKLERIKASKQTEKPPRCGEGILRLTKGLEDDIYIKY